MVENLLSQSDKQWFRLGYLHKRFSVKNNEIDKSQDSKLMKRVSILP